MKDFLVGAVAISFGITAVLVFLTFNVGLIWLIRHFISSM